MKFTDLDNLVRRNSAPENQSISTADGLAAARVVIAQAEAEGVEWALVGGLAMHLYGYTRATKDVDFLASAVLGLEPTQAISFGGESYTVEVGGRAIRVDVIVRDDFFRLFYERALTEAHVLQNGMRIVSPAWLAILKYLAGRGKDQLDLLWLLAQPGLVERELVKSHLESVLGLMGAQAVLRGLEDFYIRAAAMRAGDENER